MGKKYVIAVIATLLLSSCGSSFETEPTELVIPDKQSEYKKQTEDLAREMMGKFTDATSTRMIGNIAFKDYASLKMEYGTGKVLDKSVVFEGSKGYVLLQNLAPGTKYQYRVFDDEMIISNGVFETESPK